MSLIYGIDYGDLKFSKRHELDKKAYAKYVDQFEDLDNYLTFNSWYASEDHKQRIRILLRKTKLEQIQKIRNMNEKQKFR